MKKELIERLLNEQATPEEEHLIARMLQEEEDMDSWLTEDETAEYERIVHQHSAKRHLLQWAIAAIIVVLIAAGALVLWPKEQVNDMVAEQKAKDVTEPVIRDVETPVAVTTHSKFSASPKKAPKRMKRQITINTTDSLQYYITRLEKELENVNESSYTAKAEEVLRADARLQKLVQRIMMGELTKDNAPAEVLNTNKTMEEQP